MKPMRIKSKIERPSQAKPSFPFIGRYSGSCACCLAPYERGTRLAYDPKRAGYVIFAHVPAERQRKEYHRVAEPLPPADEVASAHERYPSSPLFDRLRQAQKAMYE